MTIIKTPTRRHIVENKTKQLMLEQPCTTFDFAPAATVTSKYDL